ncbi:MAG: DNA starvation/stationary phase protection protein Dps [Candidatus Kapaibacterium sp.]|jgi:starvation-inducible DNA-binding protein
MYKTKNDLPLATRTKACAHLNELLAACIDLQLQSKQAHWNVKGPDFIALHELFDKIVTAAAEYVDLVAERIVQLGGIAEGTLRAIEKRSSLPKYPMNIANGVDHVNALSSSIAACGKHVRKGIDQSDKLHDADTTDILTEISRGLDKWLWFVEAQLQAKS